MASGQTETPGFHFLEATINDIHAAFASGEVTAERLVELYTKRIEAYDRNGPKINSIITIDPGATEEARRLDRAFASGGLTGPLHGIPVILKDQIDARGTPTTLGSVIFNDFFPDKDSFVVERLR